MKLPVSNRLLLCAAMVPQGARVADVGTDHGYLAIYLLQHDIACFVTASDLRPGPLQKARENAAKFHTDDRMAFVLSDGLDAIPPDAADTVVMAGMGGDLMVRILEKASWLQQDSYTLVLQPQSAGQAVRVYLAEHGFFIEREEPVADGHFIYTVLRAKYGRPMRLSPGESYVTRQLLECGSPLVKDYVNRVTESMVQTMAALRRAQRPVEEKLQYYAQALQEIREMKLP